MSKRNIYAIDINATRAHGQAWVSVSVFRALDASDPYGSAVDTSCENYPHLHAKQTAITGASIARLRRVQDALVGVSK